MFARRIESVLESFLAEFLPFSILIDLQDTKISTLDFVIEKFKTFVFLGHPGTLLYLNTCFQKFSLRSLFL